ncbi:hypothetical protein KEM54_006069 [Ascosphaera aggregata]|nr:hypothetical protein KEM54_006069 [Ascosphaera aggregata]
MAPSNAPQMPSSSIQPGKYLSFFTLGSSLHNILTRIKALPHFYPSLDVLYSPTDPISDPVIINLPDNGVRLRFDGPDQRLRLIEVLEHGFGRMAIVYKGDKVGRRSSSSALSSPSKVNAQEANSQGPTFTQIYHRIFGPSYPGEYIPPSSSSSKYGTYILSYPGVAFSFPLLHEACSGRCDFVSLMSSSAALPATSMSIFSGKSWAEARAHLYARPPRFPRNGCLFAPGPRSGSSNSVTGSPFTQSKSREKEYLADEVEKIVLHGGGKVNILRRSGSTFCLKLSETTPQDLIAELGPPDAIYRRPDRRIAIHKTTRRKAFGKARSESTVTTGTSLESTDNGVLSSETGTLGSDDEEKVLETWDEDSDGAEGFDGGKEITEECFFNYFHHGFDVFISYPRSSSSPSFTSSSKSASITTPTPSSPSSFLTATKILIHGNIPGSYPFNRHRRCQWVLALPSSSSQLDSEARYPVISSALQEFFRPYYDSPEDEAEMQKGMVMNRGWGESPGSSIDLFGNWEDGEGEKTVTRVTDGDGDGNGDGDISENKTDAQIEVLGNTQLFGFPGLLFEVLKNGAVSCLSVY